MTQLTGWCTQRGRHPLPSKCRDPMCPCWCHDDRDDEQQETSERRPVETITPDPTLFG